MKSTISILVALALCLSGIALAQNPVPLINQPLVPDSVAPGGSAFTLTVNGSGFVSGSLVNWNNSALTTKFVSQSQLTASVPASDIAKAGTASVTVVNPSGDRTSNTVFFSIATSTSIAMSGSEYSVGASPPAVSTADLNGDGKLDLVLTNSSDNTISVLLGNGDGTFQAQVTYAVGESPRDIAIADFNGDGKLDLAVTNTNSSTVSVLLGNGDGTFQTQVQYDTGTGAYGIATADVNGDGKLDLLVTNSGTNTISVLLGNGDGTFQAAMNYLVDSDPRSVAVGDFNGDGKLDLAVANFDPNTVTVLLGNGDGTFSTLTSYSTGSGTRFLTTADFNGDGKLDLAVVNQFNDTISVLLGNGDGTFQTPVNYATGVLPTWVGTADFNGDGKLDLATADSDNVGGIVASILLGNGDGTFQTNTDYYNGQNSDQLAIGDFNGDGRLDLAAAEQSSTVVFVLLQGATTVTLLPDALTFGDQVVGTASAAQTLTLTNTGTTALKVNSIAAAPNFSQTNTCGASLPVGASCTISVTFKPTGEGPLAGAVTVTGSAVGSPFVIPLSGTGVSSGPNVTLSATELSFSTQLLGTASTAQSITLTNYGAKALRVTKIVASGDFSQTNTCGWTLPEGASCTISVTFTPTQVGTRNGAVSITDNAPHSPQNVSLTGVGTSVEFNPSSLFFSTKGEKQTTLTNVGSSALSISSIVITGSGVFSQTNTCGSEVAAGGSCTITVTFTGKGEGLFSADVVVSDNGGASPQEVSLSAVRKKGCGKPCPQ